LSFKLFNAPLPAPLVAGLAACRRHLLFATLFSALLNLLFLAPTIYMMQVYDRVVPTEGRLTLLYLTLVVGFALLVLAALDAVRSRLMILASMRLDRVLSRPLLDRLMKNRPSAAAPQGMRDFDTVRQVISGPIATALMDAPWAPLYVFAAFLIHPALGGLIITGGVILFALAVANERATRSGINEGVGKQNQAYAIQEAAVRNAEVIRSLGMRDALLSRQVRERILGQSLSARAQFTGGRYTASTKFVRMFLQSAALGLGAWLAIERQISAGSIIAASVLLSRALQPIEQIVGSWTTVGQFRAAMNNLIALFSLPASTTPTMQLPVPTGRIDLEQVMMRAGQGMALRSVSFTINPGEILGVVGPSGAGKTALARIIVGAVSPDLGVVRLDGADFADWDADRLGRFMGYVPQSSGLIAGTIRENISRFAASDADIDAKVIAAAKVAGVHEMILRFPGAYDALVGAGGQGLSAGQSQRIALARALFDRPRVIVMDEPNSALDAEGEAALNRAVISAKSWGATIIIIAHRPGILRVSDRILALRDGQIVKVSPAGEFFREALTTSGASLAAAPMQRPVVEDGDATSQVLSPIKAAS
jgi:ATP-binding cassette subfamily C protein